MNQENQGRCAALHHHEFHTLGTGIRSFIFYFHLTSWLIFWGMCGSVHKTTNLPTKMKSR